MRVHQDQTAKLDRRMFHSRRRDLSIAASICALVIAVSLQPQAQAQNPPGRILTTPGNNNIVECNLDASNCFTVLALTEGNESFAAAQSPSVANNGMLAFTDTVSPDGSCPGGCNPHVFTMDADGTNVRQLTFNSNTGGYNGEHNATISPDASTVAFLTNLNAAPGGSQPQEIYLVNADGSNVRQLTPFQGGPDPSQGFVDGLAWSPDSKSIAFRGVVYTSVCGTYEGQTIYVRVIGLIGADGSNPQIIACDNNDGYVNAIDWSPDGTLLAWTRNVQHGAQGCSGCVGEPAISFADFSGQNRYSAGITSTQLSGGAGGDSCQSGPHCIHFSPNSTQLAYDNQYPITGSACPSQAFCYISIVSLDGTSRTDTPLTVGSAGFWWMPGPAVPAAAQITLEPPVLEFWPGFSRQLVPSLLDGSGNLIMHTAQVFNLPFVYAAICQGQIWPYGLMTGSIYPGNNVSPSYVNASNAGETSDNLPFICWASQPCNYSLSSNTENVDNSGGPDSVSVLADPGQNQSACPWNGTSNVPWITISSPAYGEGAGSTTLGFTVEKNTGTQRQGTISVAPGMTLTVTQDSVSNGPTLQSIVVSPTSASIPSGLMQQFAATGYYSDNTTKDLTGSVTWASSSTAVATISNNVGSQGLATGVAQGGPVMITATQNAITGTAELTVTAPVLQSISVTPASASIAAGFTQQFTATGHYSDSSTQDLTTAATWSSSNTSFATISNNAGTQGLASGVSAGGPVTIAATQGAVSGTARLTVTAAILQSISVSPSSASIAKGLTQQFTATGHYSDGSMQNLTTSATWSSSNAAIATISNTGGSQGVATGMSVGGPVTITATLGVSGNAQLTVTAAVPVSISVTPANAQIPVGASQQYTAMQVLSDGTATNVTKSATWASSNTAVATLGKMGLAKAAGLGSATINATYKGMVGSTPLTTFTLTVSPSSATIPVGATQQFTAMANFANGSANPIGSGVSWSSSNMKIATINASGLAKGMKSGKTTIKATVMSIGATASLTVQ